MSEFCIEKNAFCELWHCLKSFYNMQKGTAHRPFHSLSKNLFLTD